MTIFENPFIQYIKKYNLKQNIIYRLFPLSNKRDKRKLLNKITCIIYHHKIRVTHVILSNLCFKVWQI